MNRIDVDRAFRESQKAFRSVVDQPLLLDAVVAEIVTSLKSGGKVIWLGNGGSAADAQHMAAELMVRYVKNRQPLSSIAITTDSSILTAHTNDFDVDTLFSRQISGLAKSGDVIIAMSTSGHSQNIINAIKQGLVEGCVCVALTGARENPLVDMAHYGLQVDSSETARVQEAHSFFNHLLCEALDTEFE